MLSGNQSPVFEPHTSPSSERADTLSFPPVSERIDTLQFPPLSEQTIETTGNGATAEVLAGALPGEPQHTSLRGALGSEASVGNVIVERYVLQSLIAQGSMGVVWRAYDRRLEGPVAIKLVSPQLTLASAAARRLREEAALLARVDSFHVARMIDAGDTESGTPYLVTELLEGVTLQQLLELGIDLPLREAIDWMCQAAQGLADIHDVGLVHNDLKPSNVFLTRGDTVETTVKLLDFGVARAHSEPTPMSIGEELLGNPWYMAPERIAAAADADHRADIWSVGVMLYELVAGRRPFEGHTVQQVCAAVMATAPLPLRSLRPDVNAELERVVSRCLQPRPENRFSSARSLSQELQRLSSSRVTSHNGETVSSIAVIESWYDEPKPRDLKRSQVAVVRRWRWTAAIALLWAPLLVAVTLSIVAMTRYNRVQARLPADDGDSPAAKNRRNEPEPATSTLPGTTSAPRADTLTTTPGPNNAATSLAATPSALQLSIPHERIKGHAHRPARAKANIPSANESGLPVDEIYVDNQGKLVDSLGNPIGAASSSPSPITPPESNAETQEPGSWH